MKNILFIIVIAGVFLSSCTTTAPIAKSVAYKGMYEEKPLSILLMPPINRSTNVEAKEYFHSTLNIPIANAGFYVVPTFLSMEILKKESAYDAELFLNSPLNKFEEVFGADLAVFTIIHKWDKSGLAAKVNVQVEYVIKSTKTNEIVYTRTGDVTYDASVSTGVGGAWGALADLATSAINTAATKYVDVARVCNAYTFKDLPAGKYSPAYETDGELPAGLKDFRVNLNSKYK
ncbi:GNA1162 family protein [Draconibacterium orientale]|uniref:GNA1162 family protein n=1 Tax=Draconibacterium orientale TaxID=1168034 RepID=UPI0029C0AED9|nr:GNA1162 family protein [Draconibacterium orientale]